eukprot:6492588-Amphidinium_carterae.1
MRSSTCFWFSNKDKSMNSMLLSMGHPAWNALTATARKPALHMNLLSLPLPANSSTNNGAVLLPTSLLVSA